MLLKVYVQVNKTKKKIEKTKTTEKSYLWQCGNSEIKDGIYIQTFMLCSSTTYSRLKVLQDL